MVHKQIIGLFVRNYTGVLQRVTSLLHAEALILTVLLSAQQIKRVTQELL